MEGPQSPYIYQTIGPGGFLTMWGGPGVACVRRRTMLSYVEEILKPFGIKIRYGESDLNALHKLLSRDFRVPSWWATDSTLRNDSPLARELFDVLFRPEPLSLTREERKSALFLTLEMLDRYQEDPFEYNTKSPSGAPVRKPLRKTYGHADAKPVVLPLDLNEEEVKILRKKFEREQDEATRKKACKLVWLTLTGNKKTTLLELSDEALLVHLGSKDPCISLVAGWLLGR